MLEAEQFGDFLLKQITNNLNSLKACVKVLEGKLWLPEKWIYKY